MRKIVLVLIGIFLMVSSALASGDLLSRTVQEYRITNNSGIKLVTCIPITSIRPQVDKIVGYHIMPMYSYSKENYIGVYDGTNKTLSGECFAENEAATGSSIGELWPQGKTIADGVTVIQGSYTYAIVYFISE